jgi:hypothetical protein
VTAGFGRNSPGAWQFDAIHGNIAPTSLRDLMEGLIRMRYILDALVLFGGLFAATPAAAQTYDPRYPVCIEVASIDGSSINCSFTSMAQCAATASGQAAQCYPNPYGVQSRLPASVPPRRNR